MSKSPYSTKIAVGALALLGYLGTADSAGAQQPARQNRILSAEECLSATGEGIYLKNFCHDIYLRQDSKLSIENRFGLSALKGDVSYSAISAKKGIEYGLAFLATQPKTGVRDASITYLQNLLDKVPSEDKASVASLNHAVSDGVIEGSELIGKVASGTYAIMTRSRSIQDQIENRMPILVNISYDAEKARLDSVSDARVARERQRVADSTAKANRITRDQYVADSTARAIRDSVAKLPKAGQDASQRHAASPKTETGKDNEKYDWLTGKRIGIEVGYGKDNESVIGAFVEFPVAYRVDLEVFGNYFISPRNADTLNVRADTTLRDRQLIGPGTYKQRTDEIITSSRNEPKIETGLGLILRAGNLSLNFRGGVIMSSQEERVDGRSTISFERNAMPLGNPEVITNSKPSTKKNKTGPVFSAGVLYDFNKHLSVGASVNNFERRSGGRINFRVRF